MKELTHGTNGCGQFFLRGGWAQIAEIGESLTNLDKK